MANIYDVNAALKTPDIVGNFNKGVQTAQDNQVYGEKQAAYQDALSRQQQVQNLAPQIIAGNPQAIEQAQAADPKAAAQYQDASAQHLKRLQGAISYIDSQKDPQAKEAAYQQVRPYLAQFGQQPPATFAEAEPKMEAARAQIAALSSQQKPDYMNVPAQGAVFDKTAGHVVYQNPGAQKAPGVVSVNLPDGSTQQYTQNPDGSLAPLRLSGQGGAAAPQGPQTAPQSPQASSTQPMAGSQQDPMTDILAQANAKAKQGMPDDQVRAFIQQQAQAQGIQIGPPPAQQAQSDQLGRSAPKGAVQTLSPAEISQLGLPDGTVAQRDASGKITVVNKPGIDSSAIVAPGDPTKTGEAYLETLPPAMQGVVKAIANGDQAAPSASSRSPASQALLQAVYTYDHTASASNLPTRTATRKSFTSGKDAQNMTALSQLALHLDHLNSQVGTVSGSSYLPNGVINAVEDRFNGNTTAFESTANAVAHELRSVFANASGGTQAELEENLKQLNSSNSEAQKKAAVQNIAQLVHGRFKILQDKYSQGMGKVSDPFKTSYPGAEATIQKLAGEKVDKSAKPATPTSDAEYNALPSGAMFIDPDDGKTYRKP